MARNLRFVWVILPYLAVYFGIIVLHSAWGALLGFHLALLPLLLHKQTLTHPLLAPVSARIALPIILAGALGGLGLWVIWPWMSMPADFSAHVAQLGLAGWIWLPFIAYFTLVNPFLEEVYWRGDLGSDSLLPRPVDFLFAGYHVFILALFVTPFWCLLAFLILSAAGWFWRQASRFVNSLLPAVLSHLAADFSILLVLYLKAA